MHNPSDKSISRAPPAAASANDIQVKPKDAATSSRVVASPHHIMTQVAKVTYEPSLRPPRLPANKKLPTKTDKLKPTQEAPELRSSQQRVGHSSQNSSEIMYRRSRTEGELSKSKAIRTATAVSPARKPRSTSTESARRNQHSKLTENCPTSSRQTSATDKEHIKRRLEQLRKESRSLLIKNLQHKKEKEHKTPREAAKKTNTRPHIPASARVCSRLASKPIDKPCQANQKLVDHSNEASLQLKLKTGEDAKLLKSSNKSAQTVSIEDHNEAATIPSQKLLESLTKKQTLNNSTATLSKLPLFEKEQPQKGHIGLLRKPETKDHSYSAIENWPFGKENLCGDNLKSNTLALRATPSLAPIDLESQAKSFLATGLLKESRIYNRELFGQAANRNEYLNQKLSSEAATEKADMKYPYWLRPHPVQLYPYNFILAVRRKLETILSPNLAARDENIVDESAEKDKTEIATNNNVEPSDNVQIPQTSLIVSAVCPKLAPPPLNSTLISTKSPDPPAISNAMLFSTDTGLGELNTESLSKDARQAEDDDTTVSSSIFDIPWSRPLKGNVELANEPERSITPLSLEHVEHLKISPKQKLKEAISKKHICLSRGADEYSNKSQSQSELNLTQLLMEFNRSLTEAIRVNEKLKRKTVHSYRNYKNEPQGEAKKSSKNNEVATTNGTQHTNKLLASGKTDSGSESSNTSHSKSSAKEPSVVQNNSTIKTNSTFTIQTNGSPKSEELQLSAAAASISQLSPPKVQLLKGNRNSLTKTTDKESMPPHIGLKAALEEPPQDAASMLTNFATPKNETSISRHALSRVDESELELSILSSQSEDSMNYSTIGLYEQLIHVEATKSEQLMSLLKIREKLLIDRTKSQIAWLEVQKERFKSKGLQEHISAIKKKQRGLLLKMEKGRQEIKRLLQSNEQKSPATGARKCDRKLQKPSTTTNANELQTKCVVPTRQSRLPGETRTVSAVSAVRGDYTIESSQTLEKLLRKRESDLRQRRQHVEYLIQWHQRLDREESEVLQLERMLTHTHSSNAVSETPKSQSQSQPNEPSLKEEASRVNMERRLKDIENSLCELQNISSETSCSSEAHIAKDYVYTTGVKLNKLWRRLTTQHIDKYEPAKRYKLCKSDLEKLYEEAKSTVLQIFMNEDGCSSRNLMDCSVLTSSPNSQTPVPAETARELELVAEIRPLSLSASSDSDDATSCNTMRSDYCPCVTNENLSSRRTSGSESDSARREISERKKLIENNKKKFLSLSQMVVAKHVGLQRSLSDSKISSVDFESLSTTSENLPLSASTREGLACRENQTVVDTLSAISKSSEHVAQTKRPSVICETLATNSECAATDATVISEATLDDPISAAIIEDEQHLKESDASIVWEANCHAPVNSQHSINDDVDRLNMSSECNSYSSKFEDASAEMHSPSGCTLRTENSGIRSAQSQVGSSGSKTQLDMISQTSLAELEPEAEEESCIADESMPQFNTTVESTLDDVSHDLGSTPAEVVAENGQSTPPLSPANKLDSNNSSQLMPDIINNLENRRCQHIAAETEKSCESTASAPYVYIREIPNKPPPPYVPPAPGSPMTTIFPSEDRIKSLTFRRTHELFCQLSNIEYINSRGEKLPSVMEEKITNIYERIILDICREFLEEHKEVLRQGDPSNFHSSLVFYNPPDRLRCIQNSIYKEVRRCLAMDKPSSKRAQVFSVYGHRSKRDYIGKIIIQELYDEDEQWCNFHCEENEVLKLMIDEMVTQYAEQIIKDAWEDQQAAESATVCEKDQNSIDTNTAPQIAMSESLVDCLESSL